MTSSLPRTRETAFIALFGSSRGKPLGTIPWSILRAAAGCAEHPLLAGWPEGERGRFRAALRLVELGFPLHAEEPTELHEPGDVVRSFHPRVRDATERTIWLVAIDASGAVADEVLVQSGGSTEAPPESRTLLRHALIRGAATIWIVDYRPVARLDALGDTARTLRDLTSVANTVGIKVRDWILLGTHGACSVREAIAERDLASAVLTAA